MTEAVDNSCPAGHGYMVPVGSKYAYVPKGDGLIQAVVEWISRDGERKTYIDALSQDVAAQLPTWHSDHLGDAIQALQNQGKLVEFFGQPERYIGYFRLDDRRPGHLWTYNFWMSEVRKPGLSLMPDTLYHFYGDEDAHEFPRLEHIDDVLTLMTDPSAITITDTSGSYDKTVDDPQVKAKWDLDDRIVVWDLGAIQRNLNVKGH